MPPEQFEALKADIAERGVLVPIDVDEQGHILDGHHRYRACVELGIGDFPTIVRPGLSEEDRRVFARKSNMLRRHLTRKQIRHLIAEQLKDTPSWANNRIAGVLGVDSKTVQAERRRLERTSEIPKFDKLVGADGKARPVKQKRPPAIMAPNEDELSRVLKQLEGGASIEELQGFLSAQGLTTFVTLGYDPFAGCDDAGKRAWLLFMFFAVDFLKADRDSFGQHIEWVLGKDFKTPAEWLGEEGVKWRRHIGQRRPEFSKKFLRAWDAFLAGHDGQSLADVEAMMAADAKAA